MTQNAQKLGNAAQHNEVQPRGALRLNLGSLVKLLPVFALVAAGVLLVPGGEAHAGFWDALSFTGGTFAALIGNVLYYSVLVPVAYILSGTAWVADQTMQPTGITTSSFVQLGWSVTRDFANMLFIVILLGIALDFILFQSIGVKRALPRLLLIALLINFSLPLAGILIDFSNITTDFFLQKVGGAQFTATIAQNLDMTGLLQNGLVGDPSQAGDIGKTQMNTLLDIIFAILFMAGTAFIFLALALMFLVRTGYLYVLLTILPVVLVLSAFPPTSGNFGSWMRRFVQWTMFAPIAAFFLYLSLSFFSAEVATGMRHATTAAIDQSYALAAPAATSTDKIGFLERMYGYITIWVFMLGSLFAAQSFGIGIAGSAMKAFQQTGRWARGKAAQYTKRGAGAAARGARLGKGLDKAAEWASQKKVLSTLGVGRGLRGIASKTEQAVKQQEMLTPQEKATYEKYSDQQLLAQYQDLLKSPVPGSKAKAAQVAEMLSQREGNALTVKDKDGNIDDTATIVLRTEAYDNAKRYNNRTSMRAVAAKDPRVGLHAVTERYKGKPAGTKIDDMTEAEAEAHVYKNIKPKDIAELPDSFFTSAGGKDMVDNMMDKKAITSAHLKAALDAQNTEFFARVKSYIAGKGGIGVAGPPPTGLYAQNFGLAKTLSDSANVELLGLVT